VLVDFDPGRPGTGGLPWFTAAVIWTLLLQAGLLLVLLNSAVVADVGWLV